MSRRKRANTVVKFPIGRVVREHRVGASLGGTPELQAIEQAAISVRRAISTLRRQQASLNLLAARASKKVTPEQHAGTGGVAYSRPGRIAGSTNVAARDLVDPATHAYLPPETLRQKFKAAGALDAGRVITYCGAGIAASSDAFVLTLLGGDDVAVYDASLSEWGNDPTLPMERD